MFFNSALHKMGVPHRLPDIPPEFSYMHTQTLPTPQKFEGEWKNRNAHKDVKRVRRGNVKVVKEKPIILPKPRKQRPKIWVPHYNHEVHSRYYDKVKDTEEFKAKKREIANRHENVEKRRIAYILRKEKRRIDREERKITNDAKRKELIQAKAWSKYQKKKQKIHTNI